MSFVHRKLYRYHIDNLLISEKKRKQLYNQINKNYNKIINTL